MRYFSGIFAIFSFHTPIMGKKAFRDISTSPLWHLVHFHLLLTEFLLKCFRIITRWPKKSNFDKSESNLCQNLMITCHLLDLFCFIVSCSEARFYFLPFYRFIQIVILFLFFFYRSNIYKEGLAITTVCYQDGFDETFIKKNRS